MKNRIVTKIFWNTRNYCYLCTMLKEYWFSILTVIILAVIVTFGIKGVARQHGDMEKPTSYLPISASETPEQILTRKGYTVSYNKDTKIPNWVAWHLTAEHTTGPHRRPTSAWHEDMQVPAPRTTLADYRDTDWTRGHMCPAGDNKWDADAMYETFLFTNCCPQHANLNSGVWNQIEMACRRWAEKYGDIYIVCGPILFRQEHETIGPNKIVVPEAFFKVVLCLNGTPKGIGFICRNTDGSKAKDFYVNSISQVERITRMTFFPNIPKDIVESVKTKADLNEWDNKALRLR